MSCIVVIGALTVLGVVAWNKEKVLEYVLKVKDFFSK